MESGLFDDLLPQQADPFANISAEPGFTPGDFLKGLKRGVQQIPGSLTGLADVPGALLTGERYADKAADKLGDVTGFTPGQWAKDTHLSPGGEAAMQQLDTAWKQSGADRLGSALLGNWDDLPEAWRQADLAATGKAIAANPGAAAMNVVESIPGMLVGGGIGKGLAVAGKVAPVIAGAAGEGLITAGGAMDQIDRDADPRSAAASALAAGAGTGLIAGIGGKVAQRLGLEDVQTAMAGGRADDVGRGMFGRIGGGAVAEAGQEFLQSGQEQAWQNFAEDKPLGEGVIRSSVEGAIAGLVMGGGSNLLPARPQQPVVVPRQDGQGDAVIDPATGPISAAAADHIERTQTDQDLFGDLAPAAPVAGAIEPLADLPETAGADLFSDLVPADAQVTASNPLDDFAAQVEPTNLEDAQALAALTNGAQVVAPHPSGTGFIIGPREWFQPDRIDPALQPGNDLLKSGQISTPASDLSVRIQSVLDAYNNAGHPDNGNIIRAALTSRTPTEQSVAFWEKQLDRNLRTWQAIAGQGQPVQAKLRIADDLWQGDREQTTRHFVPDDVTAAVLARSNALVQQLAERGVHLDEVDSRFPADVTALKAEDSGLRGLFLRYAKQREAQAKGYKRFDPAALAKTEKELFQAIGYQPPAMTPRGWEGFQAGDRVATKAGTTGTLSFDETGTIARVTPDVLADGSQNTSGRGVFSVAPGEVSKATPVVAAQPAKIENYGEHIGGSRADRWRLRGLSVEDLAEMSATEAAGYVSKEAVWPKPDYAKLIGEGMVPAAAALLKQIRDRMTVAPRKDTEEGRRDYVEAVSLIREAAKAIKTEEDVKALAGKVNRALSIPDSLGLVEREKPEIKAALNKLWSIFKGRSSPLTVSWSDQRKAKQMLAEGWPAAKKQTVKVERDSRELPNRPHLDNLKRTGPDVRNGQDITPQQLAEAFGFRGIEFGNWAANDERQKSINLAYEALHDLSRVLKIPPRALSLNGTLGLAFGARGGGRHAAHYEPGKLVVNLTKLNGAGSLAHEFGHALDHYLGELDRSDAYGGKARGASGWMNSRRDLKNLRPELAAAFDQVMTTLFNRHRTQAEAVRDAELEVERRQADLDRADKHLAKEGLSGKERKEWDDWRNAAQLKLTGAQKRLAELRDQPKPADGYGSVQSSFYTQAKTLSGKSENGYWTRPTEMFARAFESFVFDQLEASNYLVHGVEADRYSDAERFRGNPYPTGAEREAINQAFGDLVKTLKVREGDQLYSPAQQPGDLDSHIYALATSRAPIDEILAHIEGKSATPLYRELAKALRSKGLQTTVETGQVQSVMFPGQAVGVYNPKTNNITLGVTQGAEQIFLHEVVHAATTQALGKKGLPAKRLVRLLREIRDQHGQEHYGLTNVAEMVAEAFTSPQFQTFLKSIPVKSSKLANAWREFVSIVRGLLGLDPKQETALGRVIELGAQLMAENDDTKAGEGLYFSQAKPSNDDRLTVRDWINHQLANQRSWALGALTRDQLADIYGEQMPEVADFDRVVQQMDQARNTIAEQADAIVERWRKLPAKVADQLADLMHQATLNAFDPDVKTRDDIVTPEHDLLLQDWAKLPAEAQQLYRDVRDQYQATLVKLRNGLAKRADKQTAAAIRLEFDKYLSEGPYFPLARFGDFILIAEKHGERIVEAFESSAVREKRARGLRAQGWATKLTAKKTYSAASDGPSGEFVGKVLGLVGGMDIEAKEKSALMDSLNQLAISALPDQSYRKHFSHRKGVAGFSTDAMRAFASSMQHVAHHVARVLHGDELQILVDGLNKRAKTADDATAMVQVANELSKRLGLMLNPTTHPVTAALGQVGFVMSLGGSVASGITNLSQTPLVTFPWLGSRFGFGKAAAALTKASKDYFAGKWDRWSGFVMKDSTNLSADERRALAELEDAGLINLTQAHDLAGTANTDSASSRRSFAVNRAMKLVGWTFHVPEVMNRQVSALAAYRLAREKGQDHTAAVETARETLRRTHFDYSGSNRARWMAGNFTRVVTMFKQYSQNVTYLLWRQSYQALKGESAEVRKEARRMLLGVAAMHFAAAGALGLPLGVFGVTPLLGLLAIGMGSEDEPWDWQTEFRNLLADTFGKQAGEAIAHGPLRTLTGIDMAARVGLGDLWVRAPQAEKEGRDLVEAWMLTLLGPVAGYAGNIGTAVKAFDEGKTGRGLEAMLPKFIAAPIKAARYESEGVKSWRGDDLGVKLDQGDIFATALGFQPAQLAEMFEGQRAIKGRESQLMARREEISNMFNAAALAGDAEMQTEAIKAAMAFSYRNPTMALTADSLRRSLQTKVRNQAMIQDGVYLSKKRQDLRAEGRFANVE